MKIDAVFITDASERPGPLSYAPEAAIHGGSRQIYLYNHHIGQPGNAALQDADALEAHLIVGQDQLINEIHIDEGKGQGVAAHGPATVSGNIFIHGRSPGQIGKAEPSEAHECETNLRGEPGNIINGQRDHSDAADHTAQNINFTKLAMHGQVTIAQGTNKEKRTDQKCRNGSCDMNDQNAVGQKDMIQKQAFRMKSEGGQCRFNDDFKGDVTDNCRANNDEACQKCHNQQGCRSFQRLQNILMQFAKCLSHNFSIAEAR